MSKQFITLEEYIQKKFYAYNIVNDESIIEDVSSIALILKDGDIVNLEGFTYDSTTKTLKINIDFEN